MSQLEGRTRDSLNADTALLCVLVIFAPQLFGGAFPWTVASIAGIALLALVVALVVRRGEAPRVVDGLTVVLSTAWLWTCVQAIRLPNEVASALRLGSSQSAERLTGLEWAGEVPVTISHDPGSTELQILVGIAILAAFIAARLGGPGGLRPIAMATVGSALLLGVEGLAHATLGATAVFGVYTPRFTMPQLLTPLMNGNHLGGFAMMGALIAAGLGMSSRGGARRGWALACAGCALVVVSTLSRGAIGALVFGLVLLSAWLYRSEGRGRDGMTRGLAVVLAAIVGALAFAGLEPVLRRFEAQGFDKLAVAVSGLRLLEGPAFFIGIGRGAFSSTFVSEEGSIGRYTHPENLLVQWSTEWGVVLTLTLIAVLFVAIRGRLQKTNDALVASVAIAIGAIALQNLVDFSLEMAGVVAVVAALLGALVSNTTLGFARSWSRALLVGTGVLVLTAAVLVPRVLESDTQSLVDALTKAMEADDEERFVRTLRRGLELHPREPALALLAGTYAAEKQRADAGRWLSIVMVQAPGWGAPHAMTARWLLYQGRIDQALVEIREAENRHVSSGQSVLCEVLARQPTMESVLRAAPSGDLPLAYLNRATTCSIPAALRTELDAAMLGLDPAYGPALLRQATRLSRAGDEPAAISLLEESLVVRGDNPNVWAALIEAYARTGQFDRAQGALERAASRELESRPLLRARARVEAASGQPEAMRRTLARVRGQARGNARIIGDAFLLEGDLEASIGNTESAFSAYRAADSANPSSPGLRRAAELAAREGWSARARRLYEALCLREPDGPGCKKGARGAYPLTPSPR